MEIKTTIPKRSEVKKEFTWKVEDMFATDELWFERLEKAKSIPEKLLSYKGKLSNPDSLLNYLRYVEVMSKEVLLLANYALRRADEDASESKYQDMRGKAMSLYTVIQSASAFDAPEILAISDEAIEGFYKQQPKLLPYKRHIDKIRRMKAYTLSEKEEKLLAAADEIAMAPDDIFGAFRNADLKFPDVTDSKGVSHKLTAGSFIPLLESSDVVLRKNTFKTYYSVYSDYQNTEASLLNAQIKQLMFFSKARGFENTLQAALYGNEVPESVYHNLISAVNDNMSYMHKYVLLRKKLMKASELHMYDLYTPIVSDVDISISYEEAKKTVLEALAPLGESYIAALKEGFDNRWIDVYENEGKRSGAYSSCGDPHPFVLLNHNDNLDSEFTLAHEMGHALHTYHSEKNQPQLYNDYVIFVAEVASTCNEVLLMKHLLSKSTDKKERAYLINYFLEQFRTTVYRQTMFAEFEMEINKLGEKGDALTAEVLNKLYYELNCKYYGTDIVIDKDIEIEWARIPHFFYNFYVFQYATGFSAAVALANRILTMGKPAVDDYLKFLSSGCSTDPISLLKIAGVDMNTSKPICEALSLFNELIDEMEQLLK